MRKILTIIEIISIIVALAFGFLWLIQPSAMYEPIITFCGLIGVALELQRRVQNFGQKGKDRPAFSINSRLFWLQENAPSIELSRLLNYLIDFSHKIGEKDLEKWSRLELNGYYVENGMTNKDVVPEYRTLPGQHMDEYGRPLIVTDPKLGFVNETRLRNGVKELEELASRKEMLFIRDMEMSQILRDHLGVDVTRFVFNPSSIAGVLERIRTEIIDKLNEIHFG